MNSGDKMSVESLIDHHRWLLNNGVADDAIKNQLFMYGSIVHKDVVAVDLAIDVSTKTVAYTVFVGIGLINKIDKFNKLRDSESLFGLWRFKNFLKKEGNLDFSSILNSFVKDYCGKTWNATIAIVNFENYAEDYEDEEIRHGDEPDSGTDG